jgi:protein involved in polysaccharide export with SLBB domain
MKLETQLISGLMLIRTILVMVCWLVTNSFSSGAETNAAPDTASGGSSFVTSMESLDDKHQLGVGDQVRFQIVEDRDEPKTLKVTDSGELAIPWLEQFRPLTEPASNWPRRSRKASRRTFINKQL